jgi:hypothetical protein
MINDLVPLEWDDGVYPSGRSYSRSSGHEGDWSIQPSGSEIFEVKLRRAFPDGENWKSIHEKLKIIEDRDGKAAMSDDWHELFAYSSPNELSYTDSIAIGKQLVDTIRLGNQGTKSAQDIVEEVFKFDQDHRYETDHDPRFPPNGLTRNVRFYSYQTKQRGSLNLTLEEGNIGVRWEPGGKYSYVIFSLDAFKISYDNTKRLLAYYPESVTDPLALGAQFIIDVLIPFVEDQDMRKRYNRGSRISERD